MGLFEFKDRIHYNDIYLNYLTLSLSDETKYDKTIVEIELRARNFIHFWEMLGTQEEANVKFMLDNSRDDRPETKELIKQIGKGSFIIKDIRDKLSTVLDSNAKKNLKKKLKCSLQVFEWYYILYICHLYIKQIESNKRGHNNFDKMIYIVELIYKAISKKTENNVVNE